jgi:hypothetical protein
MIAYRKFSDGLKNEVAVPPKPAKASEVSSTYKNAAQSLGGLGALAGVAPSREFCNARAAAWGDAHEERSAMIEVDGGAPRAWADALARLNPSNPPADVPPKRWLRFIDDCGRFVDNGWAARAAALGWGTSGPIRL